MVQKALKDVLLAVFGQAFDPSAMVQDLYLLDVFMNIDTDEVKPDMRNQDICKQIGHAFLDYDMRVFNVEVAALELFEHRLNLPSLLVHFQ